MTGLIGTRAGLTGPAREVIIEPLRIPDPDPDRHVNPAPAEAPAPVERPEEAPA